MSLALLRCKQQVYIPRSSAQLKLRIGIHTGIYLYRKELCLIDLLHETNNILIDIITLATKEY